MKISEEVFIDEVAIEAMKVLIIALATPKGSDDADKELLRRGWDEFDGYRLVASCAYDYARAMLKEKQDGTR
jgi:hypothetical protein